MAPAEPAATRRIRLSARPLRPRLSRLSTRVVLPASTIGRRTTERPSLLTRRFMVVRDERHHLLRRIVTRTLRSTGASRNGGTPRESPLLPPNNITNDSHKSAVCDLMGMFHDIVVLVLEKSSFAFHSRSRAFDEVEGPPNSDYGSGGEGSNDDDNFNAPQPPSRRHPVTSFW